jgi:hypothetical protein
MLRLSHFLPDLGTQKVHRPHHGHNRPYGSTGFAIFQHIDPLAEVIADTSATHEAEDRADAYVDIPMVDNVGNKIRDDLGPPRTGSPGLSWLQWHLPLRLVGVDILDRFKTASQEAMVAMVSANTPAKGQM